MPAAKYYIRPRKEENTKRWQGPFDVAQLKDLADRRLFSRELHEYSEDQLNWIPARQLWGELFPKSAKQIANLGPPVAYLPPVKPVALPETKPAAKSPDNTKPAEPSVAANEPTAEWYYAQEGRQQGPVSLEQIQKFAARRYIRPTDLVWCPQFGNEWVEARAVAEIFPRSELAGKPSRSSTMRIAILVIIVGLMFVTLIAYGAYVLLSRFRH